MKLDLLTNATVVDDAIRFTKESQDKLVMPENDKESKEPDQKAEKEEQEGEGKIATTNQVF